MVPQVICGQMVSEDYLVQKLFEIQPFFFFNLTHTSHDSFLRLPMYEFIKLFASK